MKHMRTAVALMVTGLVFLSLAPAWLWGIGPTFIKLPGNLDADTVYNGKLTMYADRITTKLYPPGQEVVTPLVIRARDRAVPSRSTSSLLVLDERVVIRNSSTGLVQEGLRPGATYVLDRKTCENVPGVVKGIDRTGYTVTFPIGSKKVDYPIWDDDLQKSIFAEYQETTTLESSRGKKVGVYVYRMPGEMDKMAVPPPGSPASVTGKQIKQMTGRSDLPIADGSVTQLEYYKKTQSTSYVEPSTGMVVNVQDYSYEYYVKNAPGQMPPYIKLARVEYGRAAGSSKVDVDTSARYARLIDLDMRWTPVSFLVTGIVLLALGVVAAVRARRRKSRAGL